MSEEKLGDILKEHPVYAKIMEEVEEKKEPVEEKRQHVEVINIDRG
jgi:hypothetical protein